MTSGIIQGWLCQASYSTMCDSEGVRVVHTRARWGRRRRLMTGWRQCHSMREVVRLPAAARLESAIIFRAQAAAVETRLSFRSRQRPMGIGQEPGAIRGFAPSPCGAKRERSNSRPAVRCRGCGRAVCHDATEKDGDGMKARNRSDRSGRRRVRRWQAIMIAAMRREGVTAARPRLAHSLSRRGRQVAMCRPRAAYTLEMLSGAELVPRAVAK